MSVPSIHCWLTQRLYLPRDWVQRNQQNCDLANFEVRGLLPSGQCYLQLFALKNDEKVATLKDLRISFIKFTFLQKTVSPATIGWNQLQSGEIGRCVTISLFAGLILPNSYIYANRCLAGKLKTLLSCSKRRHRRREGSLLGIRDLLFLWFE